MTPLAQKIVNGLTLPKKDRTFTDRCDLLDRMDDIHCFECTAIEGVVNASAEKFRASMLDGHDTLAFLPAPRTWIELSSPMVDWDSQKPMGVGRIGFLMEDQGDYAMCRMAMDQGGKFGSMPGYFRFALRGNPDKKHIHMSESMGKYHELFSCWITLLYGYLAFINTPRVVGRRQHMPHAGLQRKLAHARGMVGKFPLHAWTEIRLEVTPPKLDRSAVGEPHETRLTGAKAQHFCRCHLRIRLGQVELVSAHWRGDPALGIKQTRYRLVPPPDGKPPEQHP
jgi:hypothetical protein